MFPQFKKIDNESGIVLFIVLMVAIIIMIYSLGILTQSMNEINYAQQQIDQITGEELSKGMFWNAYSTASAQGTVGTTTGISDNVPGGRNYQTNLIVSSNTTCTSCLNLNVTTNYDTFQ